MIRKKNFGLEPQFLCDECSEAVTNPICPSCISFELEAWLTLYPNLKKEIFPILNKYLLEKKEKIEPPTTCIICGNPTSICPYCFTSFVFKILRKMKVSKIIIREFFEFFNFDLEHKGYTKDAEKLKIS